VLVQALGVNVDMSFIMATFGVLSDLPTEKTVVRLNDWHSSYLAGSCLSLQNPLAELGIRVGHFVPGHMSNQIEIWSVVLPFWSKTTDNQLLFGALLSRACTCGCLCWRYNVVHLLMKGPKPIKTRALFSPYTGFAESTVKSQDHGEAVGD
jgi:hypothetical protein